MFGLHDQLIDELDEQKQENERLRQLLNDIDSCANEFYLSDASKVFRIRTRINDYRAESKDERY